MSTFKTLAIAAALAIGASSLAMAQGMSGNTAGNAAASGGAGTHSSAQRTGSAANTNKVIRNHNGYSGRQ